jgi:hypothetical protein
MAKNINDLKDENEMEMEEIKSLLSQVTILLNGKSGRALDSRSEGRGFDPCPMLDGSGVKAMP